MANVDWDQMEVMGLDVHDYDDYVADQRSEDEDPELESLEETADYSEENEERIEEIADQCAEVK